MEEERFKFIQEVLDYRATNTFGEICERFNISRKTGYKWLDRYHNLGKSGLIDLSRAPRNQPNETTPEIKSYICEIRKKYKTFGPKKIKAMLVREYNIQEPPAESTIGNILKENNLTKPRCFRKHVPNTAPLAHCTKSNDVWMYDFKGYFLTQDGSKCEPLTITDGYSRYALVCEHMNRKRKVDVWEVLKNAFIEFGLPKRIRSDNGPPFASVGVGRLSALAINIVKAGVMPEWIEPGHPEQNGRHERFHLTLKQEAATPPALNLPLQVEKNEKFVEFYNNIRPHESLGQIPPSEVYEQSENKWDGHLRSPKYGDEFEIRRVGKSGNISWRGKAFFLSETLVREPVGIKHIAWDIVGIYYGPIFLGTIEYTKGFKRS